MGSDCLSLSSPKFQKVKKTCCLSTKAQIWSWAHSKERKKFLKTKNVPKSFLLLKQLPSELLNNNSCSLSPFPYLLCSRQAPAMPLSSSHSRAILTIASSPPLPCTWPLSCSWDADYVVLHNMKPASVSSFSPLRLLILGPLWGLFILSQSSVLGSLSAPCSLPGQACLFPHWFQGHICIDNSQILNSGTNLIPSFQAWSSSCLLSIS